MSHLFLLCELASSVFVRGLVCTGVEPSWRVCFFVCVNLSKGYAFRTSSKHSYDSASHNKLSFGWGLGERVGLQKLWGAHATPTGPGYDLSTDYTTHG